MSPIIKVKTVCAGTGSSLDAGIYLNNKESSIWGFRGSGSCWIHAIAERGSFGCGSVRMCYLWFSGQSFRLLCDCSSELCLFPCFVMAISPQEGEGFPETRKATASFQTAAYYVIFIPTAWRNYKVQLDMIGYSVLGNCSLIGYKGIKARNSGLMCSRKLRAGTVAWCGDIKGRNCGLIC